MKLIDADAYAEEMKKRQDACKEWTQRTIDTADEENYLRSCGAYAVFVEAKLLLENQPTIDAVEVVRCEECRYGITEHGISNGWVLCSKPYTERGNAMHRTDWFCADGERKEQNDEE